MQEFFFLLGGLQAVALWALAGVAFVLACRSTFDEEDEVRLFSLLLLGLGVGLGLVPATAFFFYTATDVVVSWLTTGLSACAWALVAAVIWRFRTRQTAVPFVPRASLRMLRAHRWGLALSALVGAVYVLKFDRSVASIVATCVNEVAFMALDVLPSGAGVMRRNISDARLGNPAVIASFVAQFHGLGQRALMGTCGLLLGAGGYGLGLVVARRRSLAVFAAVALALNPWVLKFPLPDENLYTLAFASCWLPAMLLTRAPWWPIGLLAGLTIGMREPLWLAVPAIVIAARRDGLRGYFSVLSALALSTAPYHLHHHLALGSVLAYEGMGQVPTFMHGLGPLELPWQGMMNWPLYSEVVRTPHNPFPTFVLWPLWLLDHFGLLLSALAVVGAVTLFRRDRLLALVLAGIFFPVYAVLAVQENWDDPNKMGVLLIIFGPLVAAMVAGARAWLARPKRLTAAVVAVSICLWGAVAAVADWRATPDPRYKQAFGEEAIEQSTLLERDAERLTGVAPWPDFGRLQDFYPFWSWARIIDFGHHVAAPRLGFRATPWGWFGHEVRAHGTAVNVAIDLRTPPWLNPAPVQLTDKPPDLDLTSAAYVQMASPVEVPWSKRPLTVAVTPSGEAVSGAMVAFGGHKRVQQRKDALTRRGVERYRDVQFDLHWLLMREGQGGKAWQDRAAVPGSDVVVLRVPSGSFSLAFTVSARAVRTVVWRGHVGVGGVETAGPWYAIHN